MEMYVKSEPEDESENELCPPPELVDQTEVQLNLLPVKSRKRYELMYEAFTKWQNENNMTSISEKTLTTYFEELAKNYKPSTLWSRYSMLRTMIVNRRNVNIANYNNLIAFLKKQAVGFKSKKSLDFTIEHLRQFFEEAPDLLYLAAKVIAIFGIHGATRNEELVNMQKSYVTHADKVIIVRIPSTETHEGKTFTMEGDLADIVRKYESLRPKDTKTSRYFLNYQNGKCTQQVIGTNKFAKTPRQIATYLRLEDPSRYTGHSFRRCSTAILTGRWKSDGYFQESIGNKRKFGSTLNYEASTSILPPDGPGKSKKSKNIEGDEIGNIESCQSGQASLTSEESNTSNNTKYSIKSEADSGDENFIFFGEMQETTQGPNEEMDIFNKIPTFEDQEVTSPGISEPRSPSRRISEQSPSLPTFPDVELRYNMLLNKKLLLFDKRIELINMEKEHLMRESKLKLELLRLQIAAAKTKLANSSS